MNRHLIVQFALILTALAATVFFWFENRRLSRSEETLAYLVAQNRALTRLDLDDVPVLGETDAVVTVVGYGDFGCPHCTDAMTHLLDLMAAYPDRIRLAFKYMPSEDGEDRELFCAAMAAHRLGVFWELYSMTKNDSDLIGNPDYVGEVERRLALQPGQLAAALSSEDCERLWVEALREKRALGIVTTPLFLINGNRVGAIGGPGFHRIIGHLLQQ